ncbi:protein kinase family protein [Endozoicomonas numazuensis]|nr:protein kinase family protein [Endozoicomonas numazuensis]
MTEISSAQSYASTKMYQPIPLDLLLTLFGLTLFKSDYSRSSYLSFRQDNDKADEFASELENYLFSDESYINKLLIFLEKTKIITENSVIQFFIKTHADEPISFHDNMNVKGEYISFAESDLIDYGQGDLLDNTYAFTSIKLIVLASGNNSEGNNSFDNGCDESGDESSDESSDEDEDCDVNSSGSYESSSDSDSSSVSSDIDTSSSGSQITHYGLIDDVSDPQKTAIQYNVVSKFGVDCYVRKGESQRRICRAIADYNLGHQCQILYKRKHIFIVGETVVKSLYPPGKPKKIVAKICCSEQSDMRHSVNEVSFLKQLNHRNIIKMLGYLKVSTKSYFGKIIILERMDCSLTELVVDKFPKIKQQIFSIAYQISAAIAFIHSKGIIHADISIHNILLKKYGSFYLVKISDFGLTLDHPILCSRGNRDFIEPEAGYQSKGIVQASDIYGIGVVMFFLSGAQDLNDKGYEVFRAMLEGEDHSNYHGFFFKILTPDVFSQASIRLSNCGVNPLDKDKVRDLHNDSEFLKLMSVECTHKRDQRITAHELREYFLQYESAQKRTGQIEDSPVDDDIHEAMHRLFDGNTED